MIEGAWSRGEKMSEEKSRGGQRAGKKKNRETTRRGRGEDLK